MQVLERGIVFIDLAVAQVAGVGVILADALGWEPTGAAVQVAALSAALGCALLLTWTERRWPEGRKPSSASSSCSLPARRCCCWRKTRMAASI